MSKICPFSQPKGRQLSIFRDGICPLNDSGSLMAKISRNIYGVKSVQSNCTY